MLIRFKVGFWMGILVLILVYRSTYSFSALDTHLRKITSTQECQVGRKVKGVRYVT